MSCLPHLGLDLAGVVAATGRDVTRFQAGAEVFGAGTRPASNPRWLP
jgi:NADPH:quinone reductase-like Zn-dependent oxidoreductase